MRTEVSIIRDSKIMIEEIEKTLADIGIGEAVKVVELQCEGEYRRRLLDLGLIPGTEVEAVMVSPLGDPLAYEIRGSIVALRQNDAAKIIVKQGKNSRKEA